MHIFNKLQSDSFSCLPPGRNKMDSNVTGQDQLILFTTEEHSQEPPITTAFHLVLFAWATLGIIGNTLVIPVMKKFEKMSISIYLSALAVFDNIVLINGKTFEHLVA